MTDTILVEQRDGWRKLVLNRPEKLNALNEEMILGLIAALDEAEADGACRAVLLTGAGRGFCAGQELGPAVMPGPDGPPDLGRLADTFHHRAVRRLRSLPLPVVCAVIAFWTGAGGWIVIMYGALNNISTEVMEAARIDGANAVQIALSIQLPMLRKWIAYMGVMSLAAGTQLFVEPQLLSQASNAIVPNDYSLNQLAYQYAFQQNDFNGAAAISLLLLIVALLLSWVFVTRGGLFERD